MKRKHLKFFISTVEALESLSTCARLQVGAVVVQDGRIVSTGYNGSVEGDQHCVDYHKDKTLEDHHSFSRVHEVHAEQNAIAFAARNGVKTEGADIFISYSPCHDCAKLIIQSGIKRVFYLKPYDRETEGAYFLSHNNVEVYDLSDSLDIPTNLNEGADICNRE